MALSELTGRPYRGVVSLNGFYVTCEEWAATNALSRATARRRAASMSPEGGSVKVGKTWLIRIGPEVSK